MCKLLALFVTIIRAKDSPNPSCEKEGRNGVRRKEEGEGKKRGERMGQDSHSFEMRVEASFNALETLTNDHLRERKRRVRLVLSMNGKDILYSHH